MKNDNYVKFIQAIKDKKKVKITLETRDEGVVERVCIPFDFGANKKYKDGLERYYFNALDSSDGRKDLAVLESKLLTVEVLPEHFDPEDYITWDPNWILKRNWGIYS
jgi:hypothetical protein